MAFRTVLRATLSAQSQIPAGSSSSTAAACSHSNVLKQFFSSSIASSDSQNESRRGSTAGELGDKAAQKMSGGGQAAAGKARGAEDRVADAGFVPQEVNAVPDPDSAGQAGGVAANAMGDMTDMLGAMFSGDTRRAGQDIADMTRTPEGGPHEGRPAQSTAAEWPSGIWREAENIGHPGTPTTSEGDVVDKFEGTIPSSVPPKSPPDVDQNPPESVTAGPTAGYTTRGGDNRAV